MINRSKWQNRPDASVIENIISAFSTTPSPAPQNLVAADIEHLRKCDECRHAKDYFADKTREIILADERNYSHLVNAFDFFTPPAWHYYLPAFLIQDLLRQRHSFDHFWHFDDPVIVDKCWPRKIELLDQIQCQALINYLEYSKPYAEETGRIERLRKILEWWQSILQKKAVSDLIRG